MAEAGADEAGGAEPRLGPYRGPVVVLALLAVVVVGGLLIALVGVVRSPDGVSNSATVLGTFPIDPDAEGIPAGPATPQGDDTPPDAGGGSLPTPPTSATTAPVEPSGDVLDDFTGDLAGWEPVDGEWAVADGDLVVPEATDEAPAFLLRADPATGIGGQVGEPGRALGLVVGYRDPGTYVAALAVPALGGWRLEVVVDGALVDSASLPSRTGAGVEAVLVVRGDRVVLLVDEAEVGSVAAPAEAGDRVGLVSRGSAGARWSAALAPPAP